MNKEYRVDLAAQYIHKFCVRWGRLGGQAKEKYGTVRFYAQFSQLGIQSLFFPPYYYTKLPLWIAKFDYKVVEKVLSPFNNLWFNYQKFIYSTAYRRALKKFPDIQYEILISADELTFIKGHFKIDGSNIHGLDLNGNIITCRTNYSYKDIP